MGSIELAKDDDYGFLKMGRSNLTGEAKWKDIEDLINRWARRNPRGAYEHEQYIKQFRSEMKDKKRGFIDGPRSSKGVDNGGTRVGISMPPQLMQYIEAFYPDFMDTKESLHEFEKRFPKFVIPELV